MKTTLLEVIKENKNAITKKALIIGGTLVGLSLVARGLLKDNEPEFVDDDEFEDDFDEEESEEVNEQ